ncbi:hypothetical protein BGZ76_002651 [Entomortierella beljakovae]|nr:hypothetical protein BGZ76_002651 [Entomortierella beljakovae]
MRSFKSHLTLLLFATYSALVSAQQSFTPEPASLAVSAIAENQGFYVLGGLIDIKSLTDEPLDQAFYIDLSTSWNTANPPIQKLPNGYKVYRTASTMLKDNKKWLVIANSTIFVYDIPSSNWSSVGVFPSIGNGQGVTAVTDPSTGIVYAPNGYKDAQTGEFDVMQYDITNNTPNSIKGLPGLANIINYGAAWSSKISSMIIFGGMIAKTYTANNNLYVYSPTNGWSTPKVKGDIPEARFLPCFAAVGSGSKMILFGGNAGSPTTTTLGPALGDVYTLDVETWTWTRGADLPSGGRRYQTCGVSGDYLISWGGVNADYTSSWTSDYEPSKPPTSKVAIIAGSVGGVVVIALIVGVLIWRRRKGKNQKKAPFLHRPDAQDQQKHGELVALVPNDQLYPQTHQHNLQPVVHQQQVQPGYPTLHQQQQQQQQQGYPYQEQQISPAYQPQVVSQDHKPQSPQIYDPEAPQIYQPPVSQVYQPQVSQVYQPQVSQVYQQQVSQGNQPAEDHQVPQIYQPPVAATQNSTVYYTPASYGQNPVVNQVPVTQVGPQPTYEQQPVYGQQSVYGQQPVYGQQTYQQPGYQQ